MMVLLLLKKRRNLCAKGGNAHWFGDEAAETGAERSFPIAFHGRSGESDHEEPDGLRIAAEFPHQGKAVENGHAQIEQDKKGLPLQNHGQGFQAVGGGYDFKVETAKGGSGKFAPGQLIVNDENSPVLVWR